MNSKDQQDSLLHVLVSSALSKIRLRGYLEPTGERVLCVRDTVTHAEALKVLPRLCTTLATRLSLEKLCLRNGEGFVCLTYTEWIVDDLQQQVGSSSKTCSNRIRLLKYTFWCKGSDLIEESQAIGHVLLMEVKLLTQLTSERHVPSITGANLYSDVSFIIIIPMCA